MLFFGEMMKKGLQWVSIAALYFSTVHGAGFASGKEIEVFFARYGFMSYVGIGMVGLLFLVIAYYSASATSRHHSGDMLEIASLSGPGVRSLTNLILTVIFPLIFCVVIAGSGALFQQLTGISSVIGSLVMVACIIPILICDIKGVVNAGVWSAPLLIIGMILVSYLFCKKVDMPALPVKPVAFGAAMWSAILYVGYNIVVPISICGKLCSSWQNERQGKWGGVIGGIAIVVVAFFINETVLRVIGAAGSVDMPMIWAAKMLGPLWGIFYAIVLWVAMLTTAATSGHTFSQLFIDKFRMNKNISVIMVCLIGLIVSFTGFSWLVSNIYPVLGIGGILAVAGQIGGWTKLCKK